jgi:transposase
MKYAELIKENLAELQQLEKQQPESKLKDRASPDRVRFIRYLKEGTAKTQAQAGSMIGLQERQSQNLWQIYRYKGLKELLIYRYEGTTGKLSYYQINQLRAYLKTDQAATLQQVQEWLSTTCGIHYTLGGISMLFKGLKINLKTGRPTNVRQNPDQREFFKKTFLH